MLQRRADGLAGRYVPDLCGAIQAPRQDGTAIGAEYGLRNRRLMFEDRSQGWYLIGPGRQVGSRHPSQLGSLGGHLPEGFGHPEQPMIDIAPAGEVQGVIEVPRGGLGLGLDAEARLRGTGLGLGSGRLVGPIRLGLRAAPLHGHGREAREENHDQGC